jgi:hypothetical protein
LNKWIYQYKSGNVMSSVNLISIAKISTVVAIGIAATGCSTISGSGTSQPLSVQTLSADGSDIEGAKCDLTNDEGTWYLTTPGSTTVRRSNKDLQVICKKAGIDLGSANVVSRTKGNMYGNILLGGGIGAIIDHNNGSAYEYPALIKIFMGRLNQKIDEKTDATSNAGAVVKTETVSK